MLLATFSGLALLSLPACNNNTPPPSPAAEFCADMDVRARCILETAEETLSLIDDGFGWTTSAAELATAYDSQGHTDRAWAHLQSAVNRLDTIEDDKLRATALGDLALTLPKLGKNRNGQALIVQLIAKAALIDNADKRADVEGKLLTARAVHGDIDAALTDALNMSTESDGQDAYKGRTLREISTQFAKQGDFDTALSTITKIDSRFTYYAGIARTDVAAIAIKAGKQDIAEDLLQEAEPIAQAQDNGYFSAGILRDIGYALIKMEAPERGASFIAAARDGAREAKSMQEKARAMSRIATRLADSGQDEKAKAVIAEAMELASRVQSETMQTYSHYEIAGSAAFAGDFDTAGSVMDRLPETPFGSAASLKSASQRDMAWGLARSGQMSKALETAKTITSKREKVHALSRIVRLLSDPKMNALPRYL